MVKITYLDCANLMKHAFYMRFTRVSVRVTSYKYDWSLVNFVFVRNTLREIQGKLKRWKWTIKRQAKSEWSKDTKPSSPQSPKRALSAAERFCEEKICYSLVLKDRNRTGPDLVPLHQHFCQIFHKLYFKVPLEASVTTMVDANLEAKQISLSHIQNSHVTGTRGVYYSFVSF